MEDPFRWQDWTIVATAVGSAYTAFKVFFQLRIDIEVMREQVRQHATDLTASEQRIGEAMVRGFAALETRIDTLIQDVRELRGRI